ncbi:hypothetical protein OXX79_010100 [Metschnikowia pulcherrima]
MHATRAYKTLITSIMSITALDFICGGEIRANSSENQCMNLSQTPTTASTPQCISFPTDLFVSQNSTLLLGEIFERFYGLLMEPVNETSFDYLNFSERYETLSLMLSELIIADTREAFTDKFRHQLTFAIHAFRTMIISAHKMRRYGKYGFSGRASDTSYLCLYEITLINVQALAMADAQGRLKDASNNKNKISSLRRRLRFWKEEFKELKNVPPSLHIEYRDQVRQAEKHIEMLEDFVTI